MTEPTEGRPARVSKERLLEIAAELHASAVGAAMSEHPRADERVAFYAELLEIINELADLRAELEATR